MNVVMRMPDVATVDDTVTLVKWLVEVGQPVRRGDALMEVETDKAILTIESAINGTLRKTAVLAGDEVATGQEVATFDVEETIAAVSYAAAGRPGAAAAEVAGPISGAAGVVAVHVGKALAELPRHAGASAGDDVKRRSLFARNREARSQATRPQESQVEPSSYAQGFLMDLYRRMVLIREFEDGVKFLFLEGSMPGTIHQCQGQEATAVGVCSALGPEDYITSTFRGHGHALAKGLTVEELLFELFGATTGCCRGKGGSMHVGDMDKGMVPGIAIVGGGVPLAAGMALAFKLRKERRVVACFFGDGAVAEGAFHEGVNLAAIWDLPVVFVCENNLYGASTRVDRVMRNTRIAERAATYGIRGETVDGNDVLAVFEATRSATADCREGRGPVLLELMTYRRTGHSRRDACNYQPREERDEWHRRDPIDRLAQVLLDRGLADRAELDRIRADIQADFQAAVESARRQPMPTIDDLTTDVLA